MSRSLWNAYRQCPAYVRPVWVESFPRPFSRKDTVSTSVTDPGVQANMEMVSPGFFRTLGIKLLAGRDFEWTDDAKHPHLAIVTEASPTACSRMAAQLAGTFALDP